jgi:hypothetical protein
MRTCRFPGDAEGNPNLALALGVKTCCSHGAGCGGKKPSSCEHRISEVLETDLASELKNTARERPRDLTK